MGHDSSVLWELEIGGQLARCAVQLPLQQQIPLGDDNGKKQRRRVVVAKSRSSHPSQKGEGWSIRWVVSRMEKQTTTTADSLGDDNKEEQLQIKLVQPT
jgi:hypothetical protein